MSLAKSAATVGLLTLISRIFGFIRDILTAGVIGAGPIADAFIVALKLPNLFRRITAEGAFTVAFVPIYSRARREDGDEKADLFAGQTLSVMLMFLIPFTLIFIAVMPWILCLIAPGFETGTVRYDMAVEMTRITFPYLLMMSVASLLGGVLNARDRFGPFAAAPILFNCSLIFMLLGFAGRMQTPGHAMAWGVIVAGIVQIIWLYACLKRYGFAFNIRRPKFAPRVKRLFKLMGPSVMGAGIVQVNLFTDMIIASFLPVGAVSFLYYADRVYQLPLSVIPSAIGTSMLPRMAHHIAGGEKDEANRLFNRAMEYSLLLGIPAATALVAIAYTVVTVLFERGAFGPAETAATAGALAAFALSLPAYAAAKVYATVCYAHENTVTPVKVGAAAAVLNVIASIILSQFFAHVGIALATSIAAWVQLGLYAVIVHRKHDISFDGRVLRRIPLIALSAVIMAAAVYYADAALIPLAGEVAVYKIAVLAFLVGFGLSLYGALCIVLKIVNIGEVIKMIRK